MSDLKNKLVFASSYAYSQGLNFREYLAAAAMQGMLACPVGEGVISEMAKSAVKCSDALIAELEKKS